VEKWGKMDGDGWFCGSGGVAAAWWSVWRWKSGVVKVCVDWDVCFGGVRVEMGVRRSGENEGEWGNCDPSRKASERVQSSARSRSHSRRGVHSV
jgi:hypothetical protein